MRQRGLRCVRVVLPLGLHLPAQRLQRPQRHGHAAPRVLVTQQADEARQAGRPFFPQRAGVGVAQCIGGDPGRAGGLLGQQRQLSTMDWSAGPPGPRPATAGRRCCRAGRPRPAGPAGRPGARARPAAEGKGRTRACRRAAAVPSCGAFIAFLATAQYRPRLKPWRSRPPSWWAAWAARRGCSRTRAACRRSGPSGPPPAPGRHRRCRPGPAGSRRRCCWR